MPKSILLTSLWTDMSHLCLLACRRRQAKFVSYQVSNLVYVSRFTLVIKTLLLHTLSISGDFHVHEEPCLLWRIFAYMHFNTCSIFVSSWVQWTTNSYGKNQYYSSILFIYYCLNGDSTFGLYLSSLSCWLNNPRIAS